MLKTWTRWMIVGLIFSASACNKSGLRGGAAIGTTEPETAGVTESTPATSPSTINHDLLAENIADMVIDPKFKGGFETKALTPNEENHIWVATAAGDVQHLLLEKGQVKTRKSWSQATPAGGTRTYVLEGGAVMLAKNGGHLYFLHDGVPEGAIDKTPAKGNYFQLAGVGAEERSCVVSYRKNGKRYLGIGYGIGNFVEIEQDDKPPYAPKFATVTPPVNISTTVQWGYSCFIDQARLHYYGQFVSGATIGIDLKTMTALDINKAPNKAFVSTNLPTLTVGPNSNGNGSYAMSGDRLGNVFNATNFYTLAFEPRQAMVWGSSGTNISIYPHDCLYKTPECKGFATYNLMESIGAQVGPLSALGDGSMVGMVRGVGDVYLIKLKVPGNATGGIEAVKIAEKVGNGGDPYMYTDFTGATLYLTNTLNEFDFTKAGLWDAKAPIRQLGFTWTQVEGATEEFKDIKVEVRCYSDVANKGEFQEVAITARPKAIQFLNVGSCVDKVADRAELRLTQLGTTSTSLMGVKVVQLTAFQ
ncbi:hypothetical protein [Oligoflexus tunisiensis]|uniref:hypothetical protein n=1 Tax=Oligoflexus tunisiensis TaxID=708132 RepID=UPI00114D3AC8|nr:hypothetical protein [Oligoflexus tunisiensis]